MIPSKPLSSLILLLIRWHISSYSIHNFISTCGPINDVCCWCCGGGKAFLGIGVVTADLASTGGVDGSACCVDCTAIVVSAGAGVL